MLSLAWLNSQLAGSGWAAAAGFVGSVSLRLPLAALTTLSCQVSSDKHVQGGAVQMLLCRASADACCWLRWQR